MRKKFLFGEKKAVVTSVLAVLIICFASTAVPATNGYKTLDIVNNRNKILMTRQNYDAISDFYETMQEQEDISYEDIFSYVKNNVDKDNNKIFSALIDQIENIFNKYLDKDFSKVPFTVFKEIQEFIGSPDMTKTELFQVLCSKIIPLHREIQKIVTGEKPVDQMSPDLKNLLEILGNRLNADYTISNNGPDKQTTPLNDPNSDFEDCYWPTYLKARENWSEHFEVDNFEDWFRQAKAFNKLLYNGSLIVGIFAIIVSPLSRIAALSVLSILFVVDVYFLAYWLRCTSLFFSLMVTEVDIVLHVVNETGVGINGLAEEDKEYITAVSVNVRDDEIKSKYIKQFTYTFGPVTDMVDHDPGWYALSLRWGANYQWAPSPPGAWNITIDDGYGPWMKEEAECMISSGKIYVMEMMLEPEE